MRFEKWQALGNDYLILERDELAFELTPARVRKLCEGHFGVFADGVLLLSKPADPAAHVADLRIFNPDGSEAELSGNGAREAILYLRKRGWTAAGQLLRSAPWRGRSARGSPAPDTCTVDMGRAGLRSDDFPAGPDDGQGAVTSGGRTWAFRHVSIGNPQCAIHVAGEEELEALDAAGVRPVDRSGRAVPEPHERVVVHGDPRRGRAGGRGGHRGRAGRIRARIFERGVGETLSSGTGATGAAVAYALEDASGSWPRRVTVLLDGGELEVEVGEDLRVNLTGWARPVFEGRLSDEFEKELHETE